MNISQESDSTSVLTGKSVREREAPIENLDRLGYGLKELAKKRLWHIHWEGWKWTLETRQENSKHVSSVVY
jgi:hypothetical protein